MNDNDYQEGYEEGLRDGEDTGYKRGFTEGKDEGYEQGVDEITKELTGQHEQEIDKLKRIYSHRIQELCQRIDSMKKQYYEERISNAAITRSISKSTE